jgi:hypothetical protein
LPGQFLGKDGIGRYFPVIEMFEAIDLFRLEAVEITVEFVDGTEFLSFLSAPT